MFCVHTHTQGYSFQMYIGAHFQGIWLITRQATVATKSPLSPRNCAVVAWELDQKDPASNPCSGHPRSAGLGGQGGQSEGQKGWERRGKAGTWVDQPSEGWWCQDSALGWSLTPPIRRSGPNPGCFDLQSLLWILVASFRLPLHNTPPYFSTVLGLHC